MFIQTVFRVELDLQAVDTAVLLRVEDSFEACVRQTHAVLVLLILHHRKVALNSGCTGKDSHQTTDESLQQRIHVLETDPSITIRSAVVEAVNGALHIGLAVVRVVQSLALATNSLNLLVAKGEIKALPVALQINAEVAGQNEEKLMGYNVRSRVDIGLVVSVLSATTAVMPTTNSRMADADNRKCVSRCPLSIAERRSLTNMPKSFIQPLTLANATA
jgi:hypothetical protein